MPDPDEQGVIHTGALVDEDGDAHPAIPDYAPGTIVMARVYVDADGGDVAEYFLSIVGPGPTRVQFAYQQVRLTVGSGGGDGGDVST